VISGCLAVNSNILVPRQATDVFLVPRAHSGGAWGPRLGGCTAGEDLQLALQNPGSSSGRLAAQRAQEEFLISCPNSSPRGNR